MKNLLFINACVRNEKSRTLKIAKHFLHTYQDFHQEEVIERNLSDLRLQPQYPEILEKRDALWEAKQFDDPIFAEAHTFANANTIVIAAPFWDLSYPAILKIYLERISVCDITFGYDALSNNIGLCKANTLVLITTRGGNFSLPEMKDMEMGARHIKALCAMYGIPNFKLICAEGLDDIRNDANALVERAMQEASALAKSL